MEQARLRLVEAIQEAGLEPGRWSAVLEQMGDFVGADSGLMMALAADLQEPLHLVGWRFGPTEGFVYEAASRHIPNPWVLAGARQPVGEATRMGDVVPLPSIRDTAFYREVVSAADIPYALGSNTVVDAEVSASVSLYRSERSGEFDDDAVARFASLLPSLKTATRINARLRQLEILQTSSLEALDALRMGALLVAPTGRIRFANTVARELLERNDGLVKEHGRLRAWRPEESRVLGQLLRSASDATATSREHGVLAVSRPSGRRPFVLLVAASESRQGTAPKDGSLAVVFTSDPDNESSAPAVLLRATYGLTYAEAEVAAAIATGQGLGAAAAQLGVSENTARTHLKRVFQKTGTQRQADLVRLLFDDLPQVRPR